MNGRDDEYDLIKQVVGLGVMVAQVDKKLDNINVQLKETREEYKLMHKDHEERITILEQFHYSYNENKIREKVLALDAKKGKLVASWQTIVVVGSVAWALFKDEVKIIFH